MTKQQSATDTISHASAERVFARAVVNPPDFDRLYIEEQDPWRVGSSWYEQRKIAIVLATLAERNYSRALDPACGTGHLARELATRSDQVVATDASPAAIEITRATCATVENVAVGARTLPFEDAVQPDLADGDGPFDLIVLSEVLYYLSAEQRQQAVASVLQRAAQRVEVLAVHWREHPEDGAVSGDDVHAQLRADFKERGFRHQVAHFDEEFVIDVFTRGHDLYSS